MRELSADATLRRAAASLKRRRSASLPGVSLTYVVVTSPLWVGQVREMRRSTPRMPGATGREGVTTTITPAQGWHRHVDTGDDAETPTAHVVLLGDSLADGVGIDHHRNALAGRVACAVAERTGRPAAWHVVARSGADARDVALMAKSPRAHELLTRASAVVITCGVNDVKNMRTEVAWAESLRGLLDEVTALGPTTPVVLVGIPPMEAFPAIPRRLARVLGQRARRLDAVGAEVTNAYPNVQHLPLSDADLVLEDTFADDGFHPASSVHRVIAGRVDVLLRHPKTHEAAHGANRGAGDGEGSEHSVA